MKATKSLGKFRPNLNLILSNFSNALNNFNTINIYNYSNKIFTETNYKKKFFPKIFKHINIDEISETNNLADLSNITFNKEENNKKINQEIKNIQNQKLDTNIKLIKRKVFLDDKYLNLKNNDIYEKQFFQNYLNTFNQGQENEKNNIQQKYDLSSSDYNLILNDNINGIKKYKNKKNIYVNKNMRSSQKIFKKKTVGNSFSINNKNHRITSSNNSLDKNTYIKKEIFNLRTSNKNKLKNKLIDEFDMNNSLQENAKEKGLIKVNRQINNYKKRKRYSLNNIILESKYDYDDLDEIEPLNRHKIKLNNIQKSKIIERIHRVTSNKKEKSINSLKKENKSNESKFENESLNEENIDNDNNISFNKKDNKKINNKSSSIKRNILEIVKNNNLSNIIISPNAKKTNKVCDDNKSLAKKSDFLNKINVKELYKRKKGY